MKRMAAASIGFFVLTSSAQADLRQDIQGDKEDLLTFYKDLHQTPELSFEEVETAKKIAAQLEGLGFEVTREVGGHGVVGVLKNGEGPTVLIRTDMDALPVAEKTGLSYASQVKGPNQTGDEVSVMHACGHDMHMTVFVGTARRLAALQDQWSGTLVMIGQPAEERGAGAKAMLEDGLFKRFPRPDYNLAFHVSPTLAAGKIGYVPEYGFANVDSVDIEVRGIGGHGAYPHMTKDPVVLASKIVLGLQTIVSREVSPMDPAVVTVGSIHGGTKNNVIPDSVRLQLTVRSYSDEVRQQLIDGIARVAEGEARAYGMPKDLMPLVTHKKDYTPSLYNDPALADRVVAAVRQGLGEDRVVEVSPVMGGEDFARYGREEPRIPSLMMRLGAVDPKKIKQAEKKGLTLPSLHSAHFAPLPEPTLATGVEAMTVAAMDLLKSPR
ncbi:MAG: amidohydrolase [Alphaproteobacteria bacterium]|nr:MAG: amidohydrolase [Alphaproteobacteria bacterium]